MSTALSLACWLSGAGLLAFHTYEWLRYGAWASYPLTFAARLIAPSWADAPADWIGLHTALSAAPLWLALIVAGTVGLIFAKD